MRQVFFLLLFTVYVLAAKSSTIKSVQYVVDEDRILPLDSVLFGSMKNSFVKVDGENLNFGFLDAAIWLKIEIDASAKLESLPILEVKNPNLDLIQVSYLKGREIYNLIPTGDQFVFSKREESHRYYRFKLKHHISDINFIYIYIDNIGDQLFVPIEISEESKLEHRDYLLQYINGIFFGLIAFVFLFNLFLFFSLKEKSYLFYLLHILGFTFLQLSLEGYGFEYLWPNSIYVANHVNPVTAAFSVLFLLLFSQEFLSLKTALPRINKLFNYLAILLVVIIILSIPNIKWAYKISIISVNSIALLLNLMIIPIGIHLWMNGYKAARFFVIAFVALVIGVFIFILRNFGLIPNNVIAERSLLIGSSMEVILLSLAIVDKFKIFKDQAFDSLREINEMKNRANIELEIKVTERTKELKEQKDLVENKNQEITESIKYAKRIQNGLLPSNKLFSELFSNAFVLYLPKDIVSGDFYWIDQKDSKKYFAAVDCTGHGVPGAMVSVMGFNHLNRCVNEYGLRQPGEILNKLTELMTASFIKSELQIYDGMDIALCCYDSNTGVLEYSGANNPLYHMVNGVLSEIKATKKPIGKSDRKELFKNHVIDINKGDWIYVFSDGFADQFGGPKNKKYKYKEFKILLESVNKEKPKDQYEIIQNTFKEWKGDVEQLDDVCILGVRF